MASQGETTTAKGYYSIIQYCPDASRLEAVNIGVALFCPEARFLKVRFGRRKTLVQQLFGKQDWEFVKLQQISLEARLSQTEDFRNLEDLEAFVAKRASSLRLTAPRWVKVADPEADFEDLFLRLVSAPGESRAAGAAGVSVELRRRFFDAGLSGKLKADVEVRPPSLPKPFKAPFAFQNGRLNLIEPVQFAGHELASVFKTASVHAVTGEFLADYDDPRFGRLGLIVVGNFGPGQEQEQRTAHEVLGKHGVAMHTFQQLDPLIEQIRLNAHA